MPKVAIHFAESAVADLQAIGSWYRDQRVPDVGDRFVEEIVTRIEALRDHTEMERIVPEFHQPFLRKLIHAPYRIIYRRDPKHARIVRVWRSERLLALPRDNET